MANQRNAPPGAPHTSGSAAGNSDKASVDFLLNPVGPPDSGQFARRPRRPQQAHQTSPGSSSGAGAPSVPVPTSTYAGPGPPRAHASSQHHHYPHTMYHTAPTHTSSQDHPQPPTTIGPPVLSPRAHFQLQQQQSSGSASASSASAPRYSQHPPPSYSQPPSSSTSVLPRPSSTVRPPPYGVGPSGSSHSSAQPPPAKKPRARNYTCSRCNFKFYTNSDLAKHISSVHDKLKPYGCDICGKKFGEKSNATKQYVTTAPRCLLDMFACRVRVQEPAASAHAPYLSKQRLRDSFNGHRAVRYPFGTSEALLTSFLVVPFAYLFHSVAIRVYMSARRTLVRFAWFSIWAVSSRLC